MGEDLDGFGEDELAVEALGGEESDLAGGGEQLVEALEGAALTVGDPVVAQVTEGDAAGSGLDFGHEGGGVDGASQDQAGGSGSEGGLPKVMAVAVLELADGLDGGVAHQPDGVLAVRGA